MRMIRKILASTCAALCFALPMHSTPAAPVAAPEPGLLLSLVQVDSTPGLWSLVILLPVPLTEQTEVYVLELPDGWQLQVRTELTPSRSTPEPETAALLTLGLLGLGFLGRRRSAVSG